MKSTFLLHLYQPYFQEEPVVRKIATECYLPLIKFVKQRKDFKLTLDVSLSLLEQMDRYGYKDWLKDVKDLVVSERIELVGSAAYHPILPKLSANAIEKQIILNEYALGYYFGRHMGFEGEPSILIKDLDGFFPPELAVNDNLVNLLVELNYKWLLIDEIALPSDVVVKGREVDVFAYKDTSLSVAVRNTALSNLISFKRNNSLHDILENIEERGKVGIIALDAEYFGHHYKNGMFILNELVDYLQKKDIPILTTSDYIASVDHGKTSSVATSSWGAFDPTNLTDTPFPLWDAPSNILHMHLWQLISLVDGMLSLEFQFPNSENLETSPIWQKNAIAAVSDDILRRKLQEYVEGCKVMCSDGLWWSSAHVMPDNEIAYDSAVVGKWLTSIFSFITTFGDEATLAKATSIYEAAMLQLTAETSGSSETKS